MSDDNGQHEAAIEVICSTHGASRNGFSKKVKSEWKRAMDEHYPVPTECCGETDECTSEGSPCSTCLAFSEEERQRPYNSGTPRPDAWLYLEKEALFIAFEVTHSHGVQNKMLQYESFMWDLDYAYMELLVVEVYAVPGLPCVNLPGIFFVGGEKSRYHTAFEEAISDSVPTVSVREVEFSSIATINASIERAFERHGMAVAS